jgi:hypothetical protein
MTEILAVFRSRSQAVDCANSLRRVGIAAQLINTPREANIGCGLSVKLAVDYYRRAQRVIGAAGYSGFFGYYKMENKYGRIFITPTK